jgi:hypothetical protein
VNHGGEAEERDGDRLRSCPRDRVVGEVARVHRRVQVYVAVLVASSAWPAFWSAHNKKMQSDD